MESHPFYQQGYPAGQRSEGPNGSTFIQGDDGYEYHIPKQWHFDNCLVYESEDLQDIFQHCDPGNTLVTNAMKAFVP